MRKNPFEGLSHEDLKDLEHTVYNWAKQSDPKVKLINIVTCLWRFGELHNLSALYRFLKYARENDLGEGMTRATIFHDLNGMEDKCFLPRTDSY